jgi:hypothetical protein
MCVDFLCREVVTGNPDRPCNTKEQEEREREKERSGERYMYLIYCSFFVVCTNNLSVLTNVSKVSIFFSR